MHRETPVASPNRPPPVLELELRTGRPPSERRMAATPRPRRMGPLAPEELGRLARRYLVLAEAGLAHDRPHQASGAVYALAGILDLLHHRGAAERARSAAGGPVPAALLDELRAAVEGLPGAA